MLAWRRSLHERSALGECGAAAIHRALCVKLKAATPCERTIARVLARHGVVRMRRVRRPPPPAGWYLPEVAAGRAELEGFDFIEGLSFSHQRSFDVLTSVSLWGRYAAAHLIVPAQASARHAAHAHESLAFGWPAGLCPVRQ